MTSGPTGSRVSEQLGIAQRKNGDEFPVESTVVDVSAGGGDAS